MPKLTPLAGMTGLMVSQDPSNADTPRAHITNMAAIDCLRDIGVDEECYAIGTQNETMQHTRWSNSMAGREYARIYSWGNDPKRKVRRCFRLPSERTYARCRVTMSWQAHLSRWIYHKHC